MKVFAIILGAIVVLNLLSLLINQVFFRNELRGLTPYGELVEVDGKNMHVYSMGTGENTIVLLPGFGNPLPSADFGPLMRELSKKHTVVCVEYFGIGFSDETDTPRTSENYTRELQTALSAAGFSPPYVLMPHSGSGIYCEHYATQYPSEISSIIMLDTTSSAKTEANVPKFVYGLGGMQQAIGLGRIFNPLVVSSVMSINTKNGYTEQETRDYTKFMNHYYNNTIADQLYRLNASITQLMETEFPSEVPVLKIIPSDTLKQTGEDYQTQHLNRLGESAQSIVLEGSHYIYHMKLAEISKLTDDFLATTG